MKLIYGLLIALSIVDVLQGFDKPLGPPGPQREQVPRCPEVSIPGIIKGGGKGSKGREAFVKALHRRGYNGSCIVKHKRDIGNIVDNIIAYCQCNDDPKRPRGGTTKAKRAKGGDKEPLIPKDPKVNPKALTKGGCTILRQRRSSALFNDKWCCACSNEPIPPWLPPVATPEPPFPFPMFPRLPQLVYRRKRSVGMELLPKGEMQLLRDPKSNDKPSIRF